MANIRTQIIATICGLPIWSEEHIKNCIFAGVSIFRISSSFRSQKEDEDIFKRINSVSSSIGIEVLVMHDINKGVKIRIENEENLIVKKAETIIISCDQNIAGALYIKSNLEFDKFSVGEIITIGDGEVALIIQNIEKNKLICEILNSGIIKSKKAITIPRFWEEGSSLNILNLDDLKLSATQKVDMIALSFVRSANDIMNFKKYIYSNFENFTPKIVAKIETQEAIDNIDEIMNCADAIMIARGDLALQVSFTKLGVIQRMLFTLAQEKQKYCIVATQMFESIMTRYIPSRAEIIDVSNAVYFGADAIMLGPETCMNPDGARAIKVVKDIIIEVENDLINKNEGYGRKHL